MYSRQFMRQRNFIEITLRHGCSPVTLLHFFRTHFPGALPYVELWTIASERLHIIETNRG